MSNFVNQLKKKLTVFYIEFKGNNMWIDTNIGDELETFLNYCHTTALSGKYWLSDEKNKNDLLNAASASLPVNAEEPKP